MSSNVDFDKVFGNRVTQIANAVGAQRLHASELGLAGVESIAQKIIDLIEFSQVRFYAAFVNKPDVAVIKFFDAIFDPGENPAAPPHAYLVRDLRLPLLWNFAMLVDTDDAKVFWKAMTSTPSPEAEKEAISAIDNVVQRINALPDPRSRELIGDSLVWARNNINRFSFWIPEKHDRYPHLPNLFTIPILFGNISKTAQDWKTGVDKIVHDQQEQFAKSLQNLHSYLSDVNTETVFHFGDTPIQFPDISNSQFETVDSKASPGLQVVDIVLWVLARVTTGKPIGEASAALFRQCFSLENIHVMSLQLVLGEIENMMNRIMNQPMNDEQVADAMEFIKHVEGLRQQRIQQDLDSKPSC